MTWNAALKNTSQSSLVGDSNPFERHSSNGMIFSNFNVKLKHTFETTTQWNFSAV